MNTGNLYDYLQQLEYLLPGQFIGYLDGNEFVLINIFHGHKYIIPLPYKIYEKPKYAGKAYLKVSSIR